ncbi:MAG: glutathione S-transferase family protein [Algicola sp.]|nr:glutathione S-transferase family protein [Algicola sp.]
MALTLILGNKNYSSWSLRPWILLKMLDIPFDEIVVPLYGPDSKEKLLQYSPKGQVPVLKDFDLTVWDSLAIMEYIAESFPDKKAWPQDKADRANARSISAQMHSSFDAIRNTLPMNCKKQMKFTDISADLQQDIDEVCAIWQHCLSQSNGDFLFGEFSIADAMYAPVVLRFDSYGIEVGQLQQAYIDTMLALPGMQQWIEAGKAEEWAIEQAEI